MKPNDWLDRLGHIDPKYIEEADPSNEGAGPAAILPPVKRSARKKWIAVAAACLCCVVLAATAFLLLRPNGSHTPASPTDYTHVIQKLELYKSKKDQFYLDDLLNFGNQAENSGTGDAVDDGNFTYSAGINANKYQEVTDNQVEGVIEADLFKRTDTHIFYLRKKPYNGSSYAIVLETYTIAGEDSQIVGSYELPWNSRSYRPTEMFLSADGNTVTVIGEDTHSGYTYILSLDASDPTALGPNGELRVEGSYISSRMTDGQLLVVTRFRYGVDSYTNDNIEAFIPKVDCGDGEGMVCIPADRVHVPEVPGSDTFTALISIRESDLTVTDSHAFLSYGTDFYVTDDTVYLYQSYLSGWVTAKSQTELIGVHYEDGELEVIGTATVPGTILNQYSMDEYKDILRVVTTVQGDGNRSNASLFCIDIKKWKTVAKVENFAPDGESVMSVRFDGEKAYVCTAVEFRDPVFYFDLSDLKNIQKKDTGEIVGFSTSLIQLGDGYLLGVGNENRSTFKLEVYRETDTGVESVAVYRSPSQYAQTLVNSYISNAYKSYFINRDKSLFGFSCQILTAASDPDSFGVMHGYFYILLQFDKQTETFREIVVQFLTPSTPYDLDSNRATVIDGYLYLFCGDKDFFVIKTEG